MIYVNFILLDGTHEDSNEQAIEHYESQHCSLLRIGQLLPAVYIKFTRLDSPRVVSLKQTVDCYGMNININNDMFEQEHSHILFNSRNYFSYVKKSSV